MRWCCWFSYSEYRKRLPNHTTEGGYYLSNPHTRDPHTACLSNPHTRDPHAARRCFLLSKQKLLFSQPGRIKQDSTEVVTPGEERQTFRRKRARGDHHSPTHEEHILTAEGTDLPLASTTCSASPWKTLSSSSTRSLRIHAGLSH